MTPEELRAKSRECEDMAERARDSFGKKAFQDLARHWRELAERLDWLRTVRSPQS
jgi:hypothetical protein